ncbi:MAG: DNA translocase FtsK 4TM domain-containing protein [Blautia sp.]
MKKTGTATRRNTKKGGNAGKKRAVPEKTETGLSTEIFLWFLLAVSILLFLSNFGLGGMVGNQISKIFFGLFGLISYIFPVFLFLDAAFVISNSNNPKAYRKMAGFLLLFISLCALMQMVTGGYFQGTTLSEYYKTSSRYQTGGGILGGIVCNGMALAFGTVGTYVLIVAAIVISLVLITQKSMFRLLKKGSEKVYTSAKTEHEKRIQKKEQAESFQENRRTGRRARTAAGITRMTALKEQTTEEETAFEPQKAFPIHRSESPSSEDNGNMEEIKPNPEKTSERTTRKTTEPEAQEEKNQKAKQPRSSKSEIESGSHNIKGEIADKEQEQKKEYKFPPVSLLKKGNDAVGDSDTHLRNTAQKLQKTLHNFGVDVTITNVSCGPTVTRYELQPEQGVKVSKIVSLTDDIKLNLAATDIRIEAPIPGKAAVGIEVPNTHNSAVMLRELIQSDSFMKCKSKLAFAAGKDIAGQPVIADIGKMPHLLIAGATGSGKSVCINTLIVSILYKAKPEEVKLIMIDPKVVELSVYNGIPHLLIPVVTDPKKAAGALNWAVAEMTDRYNKFAEYNVRDIKGYNAKVEKIKDIDAEDKPQKMPQIVIIVDELADLMMVAPGEVEDAICRLAQLARAAGIHLIIATQRPSVNVITGLIKANMPSRIAFSVSSGVDSRTIIDMNGAEKLLGKGDMLFYPQGYQKPARVQGALVSDQEVAEVVKFLSAQSSDRVYDNAIQEQINTMKDVAAGSSGTNGDTRDAYFADAGKFIIEKDKASIGMLQRVFKIGFNRAARIMDQLCEAGVVGEEEGTKPRKVLMSMEQFEQYIEEYL